MIKNANCIERAHWSRMNSYGTRTLPCTVAPVEDIGKVRPWSLAY